MDEGLKKFRELAMQILGGRMFQTKRTARIVSDLFKEYQGSPWKKSERGRSRR